MASPTLKELQYRTFDDLLNEVYIDLPSLTREGMVEPAQLIKIAQKCNYELGLKIHGTKETMLEVEYGRAKLPSDFYILNLALLCGNYRVCEPGLFNGLHTENRVVPIQNPNSIPQLTSCPCQTVVCTSPVTATVTYCDGTQKQVSFAPNVDGSPSTTQLCASSVIAADISGNCCPNGYLYINSQGYYLQGPGGQLVQIDNFIQGFQYDRCFKIFGNSAVYDPPFGPVNKIPCQSSIQVTSNSFCYNVPATGTYSCSLPECCNPAQSVEEGPNCGEINPDPWHQNRVFTTCNDTMQVNVIEYHSNEIREYSQFEMLHMVSSKEATAFCVNTNFRTAAHTGSIRDGFLWIPTMKDHHRAHGRAKVYICYLGAMEDAQGNLLVLNHPKINEYYEWALKERILQNLHMNGEPDLLERWKIAKTELKAARAEALAITTTPDFYELKKTIEMNRRAMYHKYLHPFSSLYANTPGWPWAYNTEPI